MKALTSQYSELGLKVNTYTSSDSYLNPTFKVIIIKQLLVAPNNDRPIYSNKVTYLIGD